MIAASSVYITGHLPADCVYYVQGVTKKPVNFVDEISSISVQIIRTLMTIMSMSMHVIFSNMFSSVDC